MKYWKLRGAIREKFETQEAFSKALGVSDSTLSNKLNGKTDWARQEIEDACRLLGIPIADAHAYFFAV
jgi:transcriptional regulator with XRE-family HTH domain